MFEGFTDEARRVVVAAQQEARDLHHPFVGTEHLLLGLLHEHDPIAEQVLERLGVPLEAVRREAAERVGHWSGATKDSLPFTPRAKKVLGLASRIGHGETSTQHLWAGINFEREGVAAEVLSDLGVSLDWVQAIIMSAFRKGRATGSVSYAPMSSPVRGGVYRYRGTRLQRLWYRYPGRWISPLVFWLDCSVPGTRGRVGWISRPPRRLRPAIPGSAMMARRRAVDEILERHVPVGTEWTASIVVLGRGSKDFAKAHEALEQLAVKLGIKMGDARVRVDSVQTDQGPGLRMVLVHRLDEADGADGGEERSE
ncbi:MAG: Clp protease N-terminal domain-containing protein [Acidimicrobiales bacterium]